MKKRKEKNPGPGMYKVLLVKVLFMSSFLPSVHLFSGLFVCLFCLWILLGADYPVLTCMLSWGQFGNKYVSFDQCSQKQLLKNKKMIYLKNRYMVLKKKKPTKFFYFFNDIFKNIDTWFLQIFNLLECVW